LYIAHTKSSYLFREGSFVIVLLGVKELVLAGVLLAGSS
jgi:hypothetical protein